MRTGRNDPCPCGSGKKYKKCCLSKDNAQQRLTPEPAFKEEQSFIAEVRPDLDDAVDRLLQRLERGEGKRVKREIEELHEKNPDYHMTNYAMGVYHAMVTNDNAAALSWFEKAVAIFPLFAEAHFNLGVAARQAMQIPKAIEALRAAERCAQDDALADLARKELQWLEKMLVENSPFRSLDAFVANSRLFDRAFQCLSARRLNEAVDLFQQVLSVNPKHVQSHGNLALAYAGLGRRADALACFDRALELDPGYEPAIMNRRVTERMREGEPFTAVLEQVEYYADRLRANKTKR